MKNFVYLSASHFMQLYNPGLKQKVDKKKHCLKAKIEVTEKLVMFRYYDILTNFISTFHLIKVQ